MASIPARSFLSVFGRLFPPAEWPGPKLESILAGLSLREFEAGEAVVRQGDSCPRVPFVLEGAIRVYKTSESGREITLYLIEPGMSCIMGSGCLFGGGPFPAAAMAVKPTRAAFLPSEAVKRAISEGPAFRDFVMEQYARRMAGIIELVEEVAFRHVDQRLKEWLLSRGGPGAAVRATHQEIAGHLGSSREVISRILKDWELRGAIKLSRGEVRILAALPALPL